MGSLSLKRPPRFRPRKPRIATSITTAVLLPDDREVTVAIRNISSDGFMAFTEEALVEGTRFGIEIPGRGIVRAETRWFEAGSFGARFETPLEIQEAAACSGGHRRLPVRRPRIGSEVG